MAIVKKMSNAAQPYLDDAVTVEQRARDLDTSGYTLLTTSDRNALFGKIKAEDPRPAIINVPWDVLEQRQKLGLLQGNSENEAFTTIQKKRDSAPRLNL